MTEICGVDECTSVTHTRKSHAAMLWQRENPSASLAMRQRANEKRKSELEANPDDPRHGRAASYVAGCRCERCRAAHTEYVRANRIGRRYRVSRNLRGAVGVRLVTNSWNSRSEAQAYIDSRRRYPASDFKIHDMEAVAA